MYLVRSGREGSSVALPTQAEVKPVLLDVLAALGGRARPREVYPRVTDRFPQVTPEDLSAVFGDGRTPQWPNRIQWSRQNLVDESLLGTKTRSDVRRPSDRRDVTRQAPVPPRSARYRQV